MSEPTSSHPSHSDSLYFPFLCGEPPLGVWGPRGPFQSGVTALGRKKASVNSLPFRLVGPRTVVSQLGK